MLLSLTAAWSRCMRAGGRRPSPVSCVRRHACFAFFFQGLAGPTKRRPRKSQPGVVPAQRVATDDLASRRYNRRRNDCRSELSLAFTNKREPIYSNTENQPRLNPLEHQPLRNMSPVARLPRVLLNLPATGCALRHAEFPMLPTATSQRGRSRQATPPAQQDARLGLHGTSARRDAHDVRVLPAIGASKNRACPRQADSTTWTSNSSVPSTPAG